MRLNLKKLSATICIACLMLIDFKAGNDSWYIYIITNNLVGIAVSLIMFSAYPIREFIKPFYIIWSILGVIGVIGGMAFWYTHQIGHIMGFWYTVPLNVWILGIHFFKYIEKIFITKELKIRFSTWEYAFIVCMLLMLISKSEFVWPLYFAVVFLMLWHLPFSNNDKQELFEGILNGIILGFIILQGYAFTHCTYRKVRYVGAYWNSNKNGILYLFSFTAFLAKSLICGCSPKKLSNKKNHMEWINMMTAGVMCGFAMYTGSRNALISMAVVFVVFIFIGEKKILKKTWKAVMGQIGAFALVFIFSIPFLYYPITYLPVIYSVARSEAKSLVKGRGFYSIPAISNDEYIQFDEALDNMVLRFLKSDVEVLNVTAYPQEESENNFTDGYTSDVTSSDDVFREDDSDAEEIETPFVFDLKKYDIRDDCYVVEYYFRYYPERGMRVVYVPKYFYNGIVSWNIRINLFAALISDMNFAGHDSTEALLVIRSNSPSETETWAGNEQNFIIHYLYSFGVPIGLLFCILIILEFLYLVFLTFKGRVEAFVFAMFMLTFLSVGMMEIVWIPGQILFVMMFFAPLFFEKEGYAINEKTC